MKFLAPILFTILSVASVAFSAAIPATRFIIVFVNGFDTPSSIVSTTESKIKELGFDIIYHYNTVLNGFAIDPSPATIADAKYKSEQDIVSALEAIKDPKNSFFIEKDQYAKANAWVWCFCFY